MWSVSRRRSPHLFLRGGLGRMITVGCSPRPHALQLAFTRQLVSGAPSLDTLAVLGAILTLWHEPNPTSERFVLLLAMQGCCTHPFPIKRAQKASKEAV